MLSSATTNSTTAAGGGHATTGSYSRRSSVMTIPSMEGPHRLDLLINEHKATVINAQSGLQQSLAILERANSKEEQESARMQVQSLLSRAEELLLLLRVICEIRSELKHVQEEIVAARRNQANARLLYARQQWLEIRLEKLLLAKKRARPGARGQRSQARPSQSIPTHRQEPKRRPVEPLSPSLSASFESFSDRDTTFSVRDSTFAPSTVGGGVAPSSSSSSASSDESESSEEDTSERSSEKVVWSAGDGRSPEGSDVWHSESEANWTLAGASGRNGQDIMQSQVLSEEPDSAAGGSVLQQRRPSVTFTDTPLATSRHKWGMPAFSEREEEAVDTASKEQPVGGSKESSHTVATPMENVLTNSGSVHGPVSPKAAVGDQEELLSFGFLPPRPPEVFGTASWNALPIAAITSNYVQGRTPSGKSVDYDEFMLSAGLDAFCSEVTVLKELIHKAAHATTISGHLISTTRRAALNSRPSRTDRYLTADETGSFAEVERRKSLPLLPPLPVAAVDKDSGSGVTRKKHYSRKMYGNEASAFPRSTGAWSTSRRRSSSDSAVLHTVNSDKADSPTKNSPVHFGAILRMTSVMARNRLKSPRKKTGRSRATTAVPDIFDRELHKERQIEHLLHQAKSSLATIRRDSIQALGMLPHVGERAKEALHNALCTDVEVNVRYRALYSLLQLGIVDTNITKYINFFLMEGSSKLKLDLLQLLCQETVLNVCLEKLPPDDKRALDSVQEVLDYMLVQGDQEEGEGDIPLLAALLLSHAALNEDMCVQRLKGFLQAPDSTHQTKALKCLLNCWRCCDQEIVDVATLLMSRLCDWKLRKDVADSLCNVRNELVKCKGPAGQSIVDFLAKRITNEPVLAVRVAIGKLLKSLQADTKVESSFLNDLGSNNEIVRSNAVLGLSAFELKAKGTVQLLLETVELDPSVYIRVQIIRLFGGMTHYNQSVLTSLRKKCDGQDPIARESESALQKIYKQLERR